MRIVTIAAVLIIILGFFVLHQFHLNRTRVHDARATMTRYLLKHLDEGVAQFKIDTGRYPTREEGLDALVEQPPDVSGWSPGGYIEFAEVPKDAWDRDFVYLLEPVDDIPFDILSYGADGRLGGKGYDADIKSR